MTICTFVGHREVYSSAIEEDIESALSEIMQTDNAFVFNSGGMGDFDKKCEFAVREMKRKYPGLSIRLVLVIPSMTHQ